MLNRDHPEVISLLQQLQAQHANVDKVSAFAGYANIEHLRSELYERGWIAHLAKDALSVVLHPREEK